MNFQNKLDIKSILILVLLAFSLLFFYKWYFSGVDNYKEQVKSLREDNKLIKERRDSIDLHLKSLKGEYNKLKQEDSVLRIKISNLDSEIRVAKDKANNSNNQLNSIRKQLEQTKNDIKHLEDNPKNRKEDDLLNSLKNKLKK